MEDREYVESIYYAVCCSCFHTRSSHLSSLDMRVKSLGDKCNLPWCECQGFAAKGADDEEGNRSQ